MLLRRHKCESGRQTRKGEGRVRPLGGQGRVGWAVGGGGGGGGGRGHSTEKKKYQIKGCTADSLVTAAE